jgi:hypothetical protein
MPNSLDQELEFNLEEGEEVIWKGAPKSYFSFYPIEVFRRDVANSWTTLFFILLVAGIILSYNYYTGSKWLHFQIVAFLTLFIALVPDIIKNYRKRQTAYAVTNKRVFFQLWSWGWSKLHVLPLQDIKLIRYEEYKEKEGTIYFILHEQPKFKTRDFFSGARRHFPTFELVPKVHELTNKLKALKAKRLV